MILVAIAIIIGNALIGEREQGEPITPSRFVDSFLERYQQQDPITSVFLTTSTLDPSGMTFYGFQGYIAETLTYTIIGERVDEEEPRVTWVDVEIKTVDMAELLRAIENTDEENPNVIRETLINWVNSPNAPRRTFEVPVMVLKVPTGLGLYIQMTGELSDALFGGFNSFIFSEFDSTHMMEADRGN